MRALKRARAYYLHYVCRHDFEYTAQLLAQEFGSCSRATAHRWATEGAAQAALAPWLQQEQARMSQVMGIRAATSWVHAEVAATGGRAVDYVPLLVKLWEREARLLGLDAPTKFDFARAEGAKPDPEIMRLVLEQQEIDEREARS